MTGLMHPSRLFRGPEKGFENNEYLRKQLLFMISSFFQWPIRIISKTILCCTNIFLAFFTCSQYYERIASYQSQPSEDTRPKFMMSNPTFCILTYHWMIFSGVMLILYCINGQSARMSLYYNTKKITC